MYLWSQEAQAHNPLFDGFVTLPDGTITELWLYGDMKELDFVATGSGQACAIALTFNYWRMFMYAAFNVCMMQFSMFRVTLNTTFVILARSTFQICRNFMKLTTLTTP